MQNHLLFDRLYYLISNFQRLNRFFIKAQDLELGLLESRILTDLAALPELKALDFSKSLNLSATQVSRILKHLETQKLIKLVIADQDQRFKKIVLTKSGIAKLIAHDQRSDLRLEEFEKNFPANEKQEFRKLINHFAKGFDLTFPNYTRPEHPLRMPIRKITQALGMLDQRIFGFKDLSSLEWQVLLQIELAKTGIIPKDLAKILQIPANSLSDVLKRLSKKEIITKLSSGFDQRLCILALSDFGYSYLADIKATAIKQLAAALKSFNKAELENLIKLLNIFINGDQNVNLSFKFELQLIRDELRLNQIREFCIKQLAQLKLASFAGYRIIDPSSHIFAIYKDNEILACLEIQKINKTKTAKIVNFVYNNKFDLEEFADTFILKAIADFFRTQKIKQVFLAPHWLENSKKLKPYYSEQLKSYVFNSPLTNKP